MTRPAGRPCTATTPRPGTPRTPSSRSSTSSASWWARCWRWCCARPRSGGRAADGGVAAGHGRAAVRRTARHRTAARPGRTLAPPVRAPGRPHDVPGHRRRLRVPGGRDGRRRHRLRPRLGERRGAGAPGDGVVPGGLVFGALPARGTAAGASWRVRRGWRRPWRRCPRPPRCPSWPRCCSSRAWRPPHDDHRDGAGAAADPGRASERGHDHRVHGAAHRHLGGAATGGWAVDHLGPGTAYTTPPWPRAWRYSRP
ncbi:hypothetical protein NKH77_21190 [Streptomyces sp. M19]